MSILSIKFGNFSVADPEDYARTLKIVESELRARLPDQGSSSGYGPDQTFVKMARQFGDAFSAAALDLRKRVADGGTISQPEMQALERAEVVHARASASDLRQADSRTKLLEEGKNPYFSGQSTSSALQGHVSPEGSTCGRGLGTVTFKL